MAVALQTRSEEGQQSRRKIEGLAARNRTLHEMDKAILQAVSPEEIARLALPHLVRIVGCQYAEIQLFDFESGRGEVVAVEGEMVDSPGETLPLPPEMGIDSRVTGRTSHPGH